MPELRRTPFRKFTFRAVEGDEHTFDVLMEGRKYGRVTRGEAEAGGIRRTAWRFAGDPTETDWPERDDCVRALVIYVGLGEILDEVARAAAFVTACEALAASAQLAGPGMPVVHPPWKTDAGTMDTGSLLAPARGRANK